MLFFTGARHAAENLAAVLKRRAAQLPIPIQMCDGSSSNTAGDFETLLGKCNAHGRRKFVELIDLFPEQVPIVCLPLELSGDAAEKLIDFLYQLTEALERHYSGLLINRVHQLALTCPSHPASTPSDDTPF